MTLREMIGNPTGKDLRIFAVLQLVFFSLIAYLSVRRGGSTEVWGLIVVISACVAMIGLIRPDGIRPIYVGWMVAVFPIGWTVSHISLGLVYYLVLTPIGCFRRAASGDPLQRSIDRHAASYWHKRPAGRPPKDYFRQF